MNATRLASRPQLSDEVADHVRTAIMRGELRPGEPIRLDETAAVLGVSVTPVREALVTLRGEGLVELAPRRGYRVSAMSRQDVDDIYWLQAAIARRVAGRAIETFTDDDVAELARLTDDFADASARDDSAAVVRAEFALGRFLNLASRSAKLGRFLDLASRYMPARLYAEDPRWRDGALAVHRALLDAIRTRDVAAAHRVVDEQYDTGRRLLVAHLERAGVWDDERADDDLR